MIKQSGKISFQIKILVDSMQRVGHNIDRTSKLPVADMHMKEKKEDKVTITYNAFLCFFRFFPTDLHMYIGNDDDCVQT